MLLLARKTRTIQLRAEYGDDSLAYATHQWGYI
jgi:hypothetical protein